MDQDEKLRNLLRADAPPERDPHFRIALLERRTRQLYQRRQRMVLASAIVLAVLGILALKIVSTLGKDLLSTEVLRPALIVLFTLALVVAGMSSARGLWQALRQFRRS